MSETEAAEVLFYHLEREPVERVLPSLLEKTLERGWRAVVQASSQERIEALDTALWTYDEASFLPHGLASDQAAARHPIALTTGQVNPNAADVRFLVDGAGLAELSGYRRIVFLFDGADPDTLAAARADWQRAKAAGLAATYWQQDERGRWQKKV